MGLRGILRYTGSALVAALIACGLWLMLRRLRGRRGFARRDGLRLLLAGYLAAVAQIIALRIGLQPVRWLGGLEKLKPVPLRTTLETWKMGAWPFPYNLLGNLGWFVPLGALLAWMKPKWRPWRALAAGALLSLTLETAQLLLGTGFPDVDDVLLNALGALAGFALIRRLARIRLKI